MKQIILIIAIVLICERGMAQDTTGLTGPAYAAAMKERLRKLQKENATARDATVPAPIRSEEPARAIPRPVLTGPAYAAARNQAIRRLQYNNWRAGFYGQGRTGPYYAAYSANVKANQRLWNGTWQNNYFWFYTPYRKPGTVSRLNDPWIWYSQQPYGWFQWRY